MAVVHPMLQPYRPTKDDPFDAVKAAHLLSRTGFGGTQAEIRDVIKAGPVEAVRRLMDFPDAPAESQDADDVPDLSSIEDYPKTFREMRARLDGKSDAEIKALREKLQRANRDALSAIVGWWLKRMAFASHPLQEKLTFFWHGHFTTSARDERMAMLMWRQNELLRRHAAGNFGQFVRDISRDPAMLDYLNNAQNRKQHPNENYARELMELFTLGIGHYTEDDVKEAARAFTGWTHEGGEYIFRPFQHDYGQKTFLGRQGDLNGDEVIDAILAQPACPRHIAGKLYRFFVTEEADDALCDSLGRMLETGYDLRPLLRTILTSKAFYGRQVIGEQIKSPVQLVVGTVRLLGLEMPPQRRMEAMLNQLGQLPLFPPNVKGWPGGTAWINASTLFMRYNTAVALASEQTGFRPAGGERAEEVVDAWVARLIQRPVSSEKRGILIQSLEGRPQQEQSVRRMVQLIVSMPEYQLC